MINKGNLKFIFKFVDFKEQKDKLFSKKFTDEAFLKVNFTNKKLIYPKNKGLKINQNKPYQQAIVKESERKQVILNKYL